MFGRSRIGHAVGGVSVAVVLSIYGGEWFVYHIFCQPSFWPAVTFNVALFLAVWSYLRTALTDPGTPSCPEWQAWSLHRGELDTAVALEKEQGPKAKRDRKWTPGRASWCHDCERERPERAHHCGQCGVCVLRMDHHCPWIGSCVGWRNHKYFLLLNWWSCWAALIFLLTLQRPSVLEAFDLFTMLGAQMSLAPTVGVISTFAFLLITGGMFVSSFIMAGRNITVIEELFPGKNPYCKDSSLDNLRQLLGPVSWRWLLPIDVEERLDGVAFETVAGNDADADAETKTKSSGGLAESAQLFPAYGAV